ncbi:GDSL-type esterase/lipase family protein [Actinoplanes palleronii]|nr:GDSL-type esterase/lipase family protein [Actinoplanes palleronii]
MRSIPAAWVAGSTILLLTACNTAPPYASGASAPPSAAASPSVPAGPAWVATWGVAMTDGGQAFAKQTLRQIVHTSVGGDGARLKISNAFGTQPLVLGGVRIAQRVKDAAIDPVTDTAVTFGGKTTVTLAPGASVVSDRAEFAVTADTDLAVSVYLPAATGETTRHPLGTQTNFIGTGDQAAATTISGATTASSYFFLTALDVVNQEAAGTVVAFGASITDGRGSTPGANLRWPDLLADRLRASGRTFGVVNTGISGNRLTKNGKDGRGESAPKRFQRDVLDRTGVAWVLISDDPLNDLGSRKPVTSDQILAVLKQLIARAHAADIRVICSTLTPFEGAGYWSARGEQGRTAYNAFVRSPESGCDQVLAQDTATQDPADPTRFLAVNDSGDHLHPGDKGMQAIAGAVDLDWFGPATR